VHRDENIYEYAASLDGEGLAIGIVMSRFNQDIGEGLLSACTSELKRLGVDAARIAIATVPGLWKSP
jgi:6,7-dimethyl-8-ribityllumazine synthase